MHPSANYISHPGLESACVQPIRDTEGGALFVESHHKYHICLRRTFGM